MLIRRGLLCLCLLQATNVASGFNFNDEPVQKKYMVLPRSYVDCKNYNGNVEGTRLNFVDTKNPPLSENLGVLYCDEDPFCNYFLFNSRKKELRLCYDKKFVLKEPKYDELWLTSVKERIFEQLAPSLVNTQGICNHRVDKFIVNTINEAITKGKEKRQNFLILNFQLKDKSEKKIEGYFCEMVDYFVDRTGYVVFDFTKLENPHVSCLRARKCGVRGSVTEHTLNLENLRTDMIQIGVTYIANSENKEMNYNTIDMLRVQPDDSKYQQGINPGDVVESNKYNSVCENGKGSHKLVIFLTEEKDRCRTEGDLARPENLSKCVFFQFAGKKSTQKEENFG
ncbi:conserved Plasmodium protein, unknown function [Plasmodium ovale curtisi]|uniref:Uncharacterized protein n=1 Tax=Plasmodium ovale curtisi TaxID=864141 RepID=A0A1A8VUF3_PLAOA|nr:conserved Plasmodium protein, unknown function [Plasmodium ovale curtisi]SBS92336.1 conserved Plasmodium protein, unknown function [Plasmodium ovale curtisi]